MSAITDASPPMLIDWLTSLRYDCNGTRAQWIFNGSTKVRLAGTIFFLPGRWNLYVSCVLSGSFYEFKKKKPLDSSNKTLMKIYTYYDNLPVQQWYYTNDKCIALQGQGRNIVDANEKTDWSAFLIRFCLDLTVENLLNFSVTQIYKCKEI